MKDGRPSQCQKIKADGTRCLANRVTGSKFCFFHDPGTAPERTAARKAGGLKGKAAVLPADTPNRPLGSVDDVVGLLADTINQVRRGEVDPRVANAVGYLTGILLKALEQGQVEERLKALETIVGSRSRVTDRLFYADPERAAFDLEPREGLG